MRQSSQTQDHIPTGEHEQPETTITITGNRPAEHQTQFGQIPASVGFMGYKNQNKPVSELFPHNETE